MNYKKLTYIAAIIIIPLFSPSLMAEDWQELIEKTENALLENDFGEAEDQAEDLLDFAKDSDTLKNERVSTALNYLFKVNFYSGDFDEAMEYAEENSIHTRKHFGINSDFYASAMTNLGDIYTKTGKYILADSAFSKALNIRRGLFTEDNPGLALSINNLAVIYKRQGKYDEAEPLYKEAYEMYRRLYSSNSKELAEVLNNYAKFLVEQGKLEEAGTLYSEAYEIYKRLVKGDDPDLSQILNNLGAYYYESGNYREAQNFFEQALEMRRRLYPGDHPDLAYSINKLAEIYDERNKTVEAGKLYTEALEMRRRLFKDDHPDLWESINNMAIFYQSKSDLEKAEPLYDEALEMTRRLFKGDHPDLALSINNSAYFYEVTGKYDKAEPLYREALEIYRRIFKGDHPDLVSSINNMAMIYNKLGKYDEAEPLYKESVDMARRIYPGSHPNLANSINSLASFLEAQGRYDEAEPLYIEALTMYRNIIKGDHPFLARAISNLGAFYNKTGRYSEAEHLYIEALEMYRRIFDSDNSYLANSINELANFYKDRGKYSEAEPLYKEALRMTREVYKSNHPRLAKMLNNMARFYEERAMYKEALPLYEEALEITRFLFKSDHPDLATSINSMALFYNEMPYGLKPQSYADKDFTYEDRTELVESLLTEALEMRERLFKGYHTSIASSLTNLADFRESTGDLDEAEDLFQKALDMRRYIYKSDNPALANSINNLAVYYLRLAKYDDAEPLLKESLEMNRRLYNHDHPSLVLSINNMARYYEFTGNYEEAEKLYSEGLAIVQNIIKNYFPSLSEKEKSQFWGKLVSDFNKFNSFVLLRKGDNPSIIGEMYDNRLATKAILLNSVKKVRERIHNSGDSILISLFQKWQSNREYLVNLYQLPLNSPARIKVNLDSLEKATNDIEKQLSKRSELFAKEFDVSNTSWKDVRKVLNDKEAAIEIIRFKKYGVIPHKFRPEIMQHNFTDTVLYAALIVTKNNENNPKLVMLENGNEMEQMYARQYRRSKDFEYLDRDSYDAFWAKIAKELNGIDRVYVSLDGVFNSINLSSVYDPVNNNYLIDEMDIRIVTNTKDIIKYRNGPDGNDSNKAALFGDPQYYIGPKKSRPYVIPLPGTKREIEKISALMADKNWDAEVYLGIDAGEETLKKVDNPRVLHIATHGIFIDMNKSNTSALISGEKEKFRENPLLRSILLFKGSENTILKNLEKDSSNNISADTALSYEDGLLSAYEAMNLNLDNTELVILSACETGLGEVSNGEGVYGLQRAFQVAGAKALIMSLWNVNDQATQELMTSFYENWLSGMNKRDAFREAQLKIKDKYKKFKYWGAFVMIGE